MTSRNPHSGGPGRPVDPVHPQWDPYRTPRRRARRSWWQRRRVVVPTLVLVVLVGVSLAGGGSGGPAVVESGVAVAPARSTPSSTPASQTVTPSSAATPIEAVGTPVVVDSPMPGLVGLSARRALKALTAADLVAGEITRVPSDQPVGTVLDQGVAQGATVVAGSAVAVTVAAPFPAVPDVIGDARRAAATSLRGAGFEVRVRTERRTSGREGAVLRQTPAGSTLLAPGSVVSIVVAHVVAPTPPAPPVDTCTSGYDPCLSPASDYDCAGGSGNGPAYADGPIYVTGSDPYDLDSDDDGVACES